MDYTEFKLKILDEMDRRTGHTLSISLGTIPKNNGTRVDSLCLLDPRYNIAPNIHLDPYYNRYLGGMPIEDVINEIEDVYRKSRPDESIDLSFYLDFEKARHRIIYRLVNYERNKQLLSDLPHERFLDLALVFYVLLDQDKDSTATILIRSQSLKTWHTDTDTIAGLARKNTPRLLPGSLDSMDDLIGRMGILPEGYDTKEPLHMYVLSGNRLAFGACALLYPNILRKIANHYESDLFILPSSVHEVLLLPTFYPYSLEDLSEMVRHVNDYELADADILSDHAYYYNRQTGELSM